jgi:hypothetical protein
MKRFKFLNSVLTLNDLNFYIGKTLQTSDCEYVIIDVYDAENHNGYPSYAFRIHNTTKGFFDILFISRMVIMEEDNIPRYQIGNQLVNYLIPKDDVNNEMLNLGRFTYILENIEAHRKTILQQYL